MAIFYVNLIIILCSLGRAPNCAALSGACHSTETPSGNEAKHARRLVEATSGESEASKEECYSCTPSGHLRL